jgi:tetratricopeptide (TPR) repeat protein
MPGLKFTVASHQLNRMRFFIIPLLALLAATPALAQSPAERRAALDGMLTALKAAPNEQIAGTLEERIRQAWLEAGSPAATLLMSRGMRDLQKDSADEAIDDFNAALALEPDLADAYYHRALARFHDGDYRGALADIEATLKREPRYFPAFMSLSRIAESRDDFKGALAAWKKVLELSPNTPDGQGRLKLLQKKALGEES